MDISIHHVPKRYVVEEKEEKKVLLMEKTEVIKRLPRHPVEYYGKQDKTLGEGAAGLVKSSHGPNGTFALKIIKSLGSNGYNSYALREIAILIKSNHPNVVNLIDVTLDLGRITEVYPLARGDLASYLAKINGQEASICYQIAKGMSYLASMDVWHRDIKPQNILVFEDTPGILRVAISDLGLARSGTCIAADDPYTEEVITLPYRAPEILLGGRFRTVSDVWSYGITCIEVITGQRFIKLDTEEDVLYRIFGLYGHAPTDDDWLGVTMMPKWKTLVPKYYHGRTIEKYLVGFDVLAIEFVLRVLILDPNKRPMIYELQEDPWFTYNIDEKQKKAIYGEQIKSQSCSQYTVDHAKGIRAPPSYLPHKFAAILYTWLMEVCREFSLSVKTLSRAIVLLELYLLLPQFKKEDPTFRGSYQLYGCAALALAADIHEVRSPPSKSWVHIADNSFTKDKFKETYNGMVDGLAFDVYVTSPSDALRAEYREYSGAVKNASEVFCLLAEASTMTAFYDHVTIALGSLILGCSAHHEEFKHKMDRQVYGEYLQLFARAASQFILDGTTGDIPKAFESVGYEFWPTLTLVPGFIKLLDPKIDVPTFDAPVEDLTALLTKLSVEKTPVLPSNSKPIANTIIDATKPLVVEENTSFFKPDTTIKPVVPTSSKPKSVSRKSSAKSKSKPKSKAEAKQKSANNTNAPTRLSAKK